MSMARARRGAPWLAETSDDTSDVVREKEWRLDQLRKMTHWKAVADLWCACWMWPSDADGPDAAVFSSLSDEVTKGRSALPKNTAASLLKRAGDVANTGVFFTGPEFPEAYFDDQGGHCPTRALTRCSESAMGCAARQWRREAILRRLRSLSASGRRHINR